MFVIRCWWNKFILQRSTSLARKEVQRIASGNNEFKRKLQLTVDKYRQCHHHNKKLNKKVEAYREITSAIATVMRYHSIIFRCFSSWKQYINDARLKRLRWPQLWRMSKLHPDSSKHFADIMHESENRNNAVITERRKDSDSEVYSDECKSVRTNSSLSSVSSPQGLLSHYDRREGLLSNSRRNSDSSLSADRKVFEPDKGANMKRLSNDLHHGIKDQIISNPPEQKMVPPPPHVFGRTVSAPDATSKKIDGKNLHAAVSLQELLLSTPQDITDPRFLSDLKDVIQDDIDFDDHYDSQIRHDDSYHGSVNNNDNDSTDNLDAFDFEAEDQLSEALDELGSSYGTHRSQLTATGGSYSGGSLAFSGEELCAV